MERDLGMIAINWPFALEPEAWKTSEYIAAVTHMTMYVHGERENAHGSSGAPFAFENGVRVSFMCHSCAARRGQFLHFHSSIFVISCTGLSMFSK